MSGRARVGANDALWIIADQIGEIPNLAGAACREGVGFIVLTRYMEDRNSASPDATANAARVCGRCPARGACLAWAITAEQPAGAWGGMYGGMDSAERRQRFNHLSRPERKRQALAAIEQFAS